MTNNVRSHQQYNFSDIGVWKGNGFARIEEEILLHAESVLNVFEAESTFLQSISDNYN